MFIKLVHPRTKQVLVFQCDAEVSFQSRGPMDFGAQQMWMLHNEEGGNEVRRYVEWPGVEDLAVPVTEIAITAPRGQRGMTVLLTNWNTWLCNDAGKAIDRVHRYAGEPEPEPA